MSDLIPRRIEKHLAELRKQAGDRPILDAIELGIERTGLLASFKVSPGPDELAKPDPVKVERAGHVSREVFPDGSLPRDFEESLLEVHMPQRCKFSKIVAAPCPPPTHMVTMP